MVAKGQGKRAKRGEEKSHQAVRWGKAATL